MAGQYYYASTFWPSGTPPDHDWIPVAISFNIVSLIDHRVSKYFDLCTIAVVYNFERSRAATGCTLTRDHGKSRQLRFQRNAC
eukprot:6193366-Pleurochrysis_carterae.AAC.1